MSRIEDRPMAVLTLHVVTGTVHTEKPADAQVQPGWSIYNEESVKTDWHTLKDHLTFPDTKQKEHGCD